MIRMVMVLIAALFTLGAGCQADNDTAVEQQEEARYELHPSVAGRGTSVDVELRATRSSFVFGDTELDLGEGVTIESVTVHDGYRATARILVDPAAELGPRDADIWVAGRKVVLDDGFSIILESFYIQPDNAMMGETVTVAIAGTSTAWESGYTWASFGDGVDVIDFTVISETIATATLSVRPDTRPGLRDVTMESGPEVVTLYNGFLVDRAVITAFFDPPQAEQGDTVEFTITGLGTHFLEEGINEVEFWDDGGPNADISITQLQVLDSENMFGRMRLSNAARLGYRDVVITTAAEEGAPLEERETVLVPDAFDVIDAPPDLSNVAVGIGFDVARQIDDATGDLYEQVSAYAYFVIPLDPPCGPAMPMGSGPQPYDANGVFPTPPEPEPVDCPNPETVSAGDFVWFESDENVVTLVKDYIPSTNMILYRGQELILDDYRFGQWYDLHTQGDPDGIPEVVLAEVQPTVPGDYYITSPELWGGYTQPRDQEFTYTWTPANTYPDAFFSTSINGTLVSGDGGFAGCVPWDDGVHTYTPSELMMLNAGPVSFSASSYIEGPYFGLPFSSIQSNQSDSALSTGASLILE